MLTNLSKRRLQQLLEQHSPAEFAFSERLSSTFSLEASLPQNTECTEQSNNSIKKVAIGAKARYIKPRRKRFLTFTESRNATQASQNASDYIHSQPMNEELDHDEIIELLKPMLQKLQLPEESSSQHSQKILSDNLFALLVLPYHQLTIACELSDFTHWPEDRLAIVCDVISTHPEISYQNAAYFLKNTVFQKMQHMKGPLSRLLMNSIVQMAKANGDSVTDGIILPTLHSAKPTKFQSDAILKLISSGLPWDSCAKLLSTVAADPDTNMSSQSRIGPILWTTLTSTTVTALLNIKPPLNLTPNIVDHILSGVRGGLNDNPKENSHIQLLLVLVTKHGERIHLSNGILSDIEEVATASDSFLKKSILNHTKALKRKIQPLTEEEM